MDAEIVKNTSVVNDLTLEAAVAVVNEDYMVTFSFSFFLGIGEGRRLRFFTRYV